MVKITKRAKNLKDGERLCPRCSGSGFWIEKHQVCFRCQGAGVVEVSKTITLQDALKVSLSGLR